MTEPSSRRSGYARLLDRAIRILGYGPARIRQELSQKGIARQVVDQAMRECDIDWVSLAREQAQRKYGEPLPSAFTEKVKVQRFLLYRGYLMEDIQEIWRNFAD